MATVTIVLCRRCGGRMVYDLVLEELRCVNCGRGLQPPPVGGETRRRKAAQPSPPKPVGEALKPCLGCGADISMHHRYRRWCLDCLVARSNAKKRKGGR